MSRDGEASPLGAAELVALSGVLRVDGSLVLPLFVPALHEVDPSVLRVADAPSQVPDGLYAEEQDLRRLMVRQWCLGVLKQLPISLSPRRL